ncbi:MAG: hypothetical protein V1847_05270 [Candidatus Diapherotrites archaeon]
MNAKEIAAWIGRVVLVLLGAWSVILWYWLATWAPCGVTTFEVSRFASASFLLIPLILAIAYLIVRKKLAVFLAISVVWSLFMVIVFIGMLIPVSICNDPSNVAAKQIQNAKEIQGTLFVSENIVFKKGDQLVPIVIAEKASGLSRDQICVSRGDFADSEMFQTSPPIGALTFVGTGSKKVGMSVMCDSGAYFFETLRALEADNPGASEWTDDCMAAWNETCSGSGTCCIVALRQI